jgi:hypothetical protein
MDSFALPKKERSQVHSPTRNGQALASPSRPSLAHSGTLAASHVHVMG